MAAPSLALQVFEGPPRKKHPVSQRRGTAQPRCGARNLPHLPVGFRQARLTRELPPGVAFAMSQPASSGFEWELPAEQSTPPEEKPPAGSDAVDPRLGKKVVGSLIWSLAGFGTLQVLRFVFNLILTRLLLPEVFGLMALVDLFILGLHMFADVGLGVSIVRGEKGDDAHYLNNAWSLQIVRGFYLCLGACLLAWPVAVLYRTPQLTALLPVAGMTALINGFNSIAMLTSERHLAQGRLTLLQLLCYLTSTTVVLVCVLLTPLGVWSLLVGRLAGSVMELIGSYWLLHGPRCRFTWDRVVLIEILEFGKWIFFSTACTFLAEQADRLIVGRMTSLATFGVYNLAVQLALAGKQVIGTIATRVAFPYASKRYNQKVDLRTIFHEVHPLAAGFAAFLTSGLISVGPPFIRSLFKPDYAAAGWMLQLVSVGGWITMLQLVSGNLLWVLGYARSHALGMVVKLLATPLCAWGGYVLGGVEGMILGFAAAELMRYGVTLWALREQRLPILRYDLGLSAAIILTCAVAMHAGSLVAGTEKGPLELIVTFSTVVLLWLGIAVAAYGGKGIRWWKGRKQIARKDAREENGQSSDPKHFTSSSTTPGKSRLGSLLGLGAVMTATMLSAAAFLPHQSLWSDETTQLAGLGLGPIRIVNWLCDPNGMDLGVPGDRMPPLSYWAGYAWSQLFGLSELSLRWFGVSCVTLASGIIFRSMWRVFGLLPACAAGMLFAFSPNVCYYAVEIRSYPLFLLTSAGALDAFLQLLAADGQGRGRWVQLTLWLALGMWTHYFGVVLAGALLLALLRVGWNGFAWLRTVFTVGLVLAGCAVLLLPFIRGAATIVDPVTAETLSRSYRWRETLQLLYHLLGHPTLMVWGAPLVAGVFSSAVVLLGVGFLARPEVRPPLHGLRVALFVGLAVMIGGNFFLGGFTSAKYTYGVWALPLLFALLGGGLAAGSRGVRMLASLAALVLLGCELAATSQLWIHGDYFAHTPYRKVHPLFATLPRDQMAIVYEGGPNYFCLFYPVRYEEGLALDQYVFPQGGQVFGSCRAIDRPEQLGELNAYRWLVVVNTRREDGVELAYQLRNGDMPLGAGPVLQSLEASGRWRPVDHQLFVALVATEVVVLERMEDGQPSRKR